MPVIAHELRGGGPHVVQLVPMSTSHVDLALMLSYPDFTELQSPASWVLFLPCEPWLVLSALPRIPSPSLPG